MEVDVHSFTTYSDLYMHLKQVTKPTAFNKVMREAREKFLTKNEQSSKLTIERK